MNQKINRRRFIRQAGLAGAALAIGYQFAGCKGSVPEPEGIIELFKVNIDDIAEGTAINPFVIISNTGAITLMAHRPDMGQGTNQTIPLLLAEELNVSLDQVAIKQAPGNAKYGRQGVGGSATTRSEWEPMRKIGAAAREMLVNAAATRWNVSPSECYAEGGKVFNKANKENLSYGDLAEAAGQLEVPENPTLKAPKEFKLIGQSVPRPSVALKVKGEANFGMDMKKEGMAYVMIERSPTFSGKVKQLDDTAALAVPGVQKVLKTHRPLLKHKFEGVAVVADSYWAALQGRKALKIEWEEPDQASTTEIFENMRQLSEKPGVEFHSEGRFAKAFEKGSKQVSARYETPFLAHAAMEPQNVLVDVRDGECEIWAPTQFPQWAQGAVADLLEIEKDKILIHVSYLGGGFGRRALPDFVLEGVVLSKELGQPVKVVWTREDDITQSPMRPGSVNQLDAALDEEGRLTAFHHKIVTPDIGYSLMARRDEKKPSDSVMEPIGEPFYDVPNFRSSYVFVDVDPIPQVWWRSVYSSTNVFAQEAFIDELAEAAGQDPVDFRLQMLDGHPRYKALLEFLADKAGWRTPLPEGSARGIAITHCFSTTAGQVVEVSRGADGKMKIDRVVTAVDCGIAVNPDNVKAQCEGCTVMGLTAALKDPLTIEKGRVVENNFHNYRMLRINEMPEIEVHILPSTEAPTGVGEPALPPLAPALTNAIYKLTGQRIRKLPFNLAEV